MSKADTRIIFCAVLVLVATIFFVIVAQHGRVHQNQTQQALSVQLESRVSALNSSSTVEASRVAQFQMAQKLKAGQPVSMLVIGDEIAGSSGSSAGNGWTDQLRTKLNQQYKSVVTVDTVKQAGANVVQNWVEFGRKNDADKTSGIVPNYDCVIVCVGQYDQSHVMLSQFHMFYENLIVRLTKKYPKAEIIAVVESGLQDNNGYAVDIRELANYYGLDLADMKDVFAQSGKPVSSLMSADGIHPTNAGYALYADTMNKLITGNVDIQKQVTYPEKTPYFSDTHLIDQFRLSDTFTSVSGFTKKDGAYISDGENAALTASVTGNFAYLYYSSGSDGGKFRVLTDGQYFGTFNTKDTAALNYPLYIYFPSSGKHMIELTATSGHIHILGLVTD